jgi:hypothetical protein
MPGLDGAAVLSVWERGIAQSPGDCALTLLDLSEIVPGTGVAMSVGMRDAELLRIRRRLFGDRIDAVTACEACGEQLDVTLSAERLLGSALPVVVQEVRAGADGSDVSFRVPTGGDVAALREIDDIEAGVAFLVERCLASGEVSPAILTALDDALAEADPAAEFRLISLCPACGVRNDALFDIPSFLWKELQTLANDVLWDVHALASTYGWDEQTILRLNPAHRRFYLNAVQQ